MVRGKKNYLPLATLVMGFGFLFKLSEESLENHPNEWGLREGGGGAGVGEGEGEEVDTELKLEDSDPEESLFPDTKIRTISTGSGDPAPDGDGHGHGDGDEEEAEIVRAQQPKFKQQKHYKRDKKLEKEQKQSHVEPKLEEKGTSIQQNQAPKRGQKSKLKKIKEKYGDQDEEERMIRMAILGSSGNNGVNAGQGQGKGRKGGKKQKPLKDLSERIKSLELSEKAKLVINPTQEEGEKKSPEVVQTVAESVVVEDQDQEVTTIQPQPEEEATIPGDETAPRDLPPEEEEEEEEGEGEEESKTAGHVKALESLTGQPLPQDHVLFCVPVVGPYSCLQNYKFRVKVTPGSGRRGQAAKTALHLFTSDRNASPREKDLIKSTKDMHLDIARNLPPKVKVSAANLVSAFKSKKKK
jgi:hypothetical protein